MSIAGLSIFTVLLQGVLSFFSPCILPLIPLYISYLAGTKGEGYARKRIFINTLFFVLGISTTFFVLGLGFTALGQFFADHRTGFARLSGVIMILFGLWQLGIFGRKNVLNGEHRLPFRLNRWTMGPGPAYLLGFTFSFAWTPCVGPVLGSVLLMAGSAGSATAGFTLIAVYALGFVIPFLALGLFTGTVLTYLQKHRKVVTYTVKIGAALLILMGVLTMTGLLSGLTVNVPKAKNQPAGQTEATQQSGKKKEAAPTFSLLDQYGNRHSLSDYQGKTVLLNFWSTWCPNCLKEMAELQALYEKYGKNEENLIVLGVAAPNMGREGSQQKITDYLQQNGYTFPTIMDSDFDVYAEYGIRAFPTTWLIDADGNAYGYVEGALTGEKMEELVQMAMSGE